jgi:hypothetical protein
MQVFTNNQGNSHNSLKGNSTAIARQAGSSAYSSNIDFIQLDAETCLSEMKVL